MLQSTLDRVFAIALAATQVAAIIVYGVCHRHILPSAVPNAAVTESIKLGLYPLFQDIHVMIFVGFGFLLCSFHKFRLTSLVNCFWVAALAVQYYFLWNQLWVGAFKKDFAKTFNITQDKLILGEVSAGAILIAVCAIIGKVNSLQLLIITIIGSALYTLNEEIVIVQLKARDVGGAMIIHAFGAFFGVGITSVLRYPKSLDNKNLHESQDSLSLAMVGTLFLWCFWPSFNAALAVTPEEIHFSILNTYFSIIGSVMAAFVTSLLFGNGKIVMGQILNATLAGGVIMGSCADILHDVWVAYLCGFLVGIISTMLFVYIPSFFNRFKIHDVAGVYNLHGVPGLLSGFISAIIRQKYIDDKGWVQAVSTVISLGIGLGGGLIAGVIVRGLTAYDKENEYFNDQTLVQFEEHVQDELKEYGHGPAHHPVPSVFPQTAAQEHAKPKGPSVKPISEQMGGDVANENDPKYRDTERKPLQNGSS